MFLEAVVIILVLVVPETTFFFFVDLFLLHLLSLVMKKIEFRAAAIIRIQKNVKMFMAICRHKPR